MQGVRLNSKRVSYGSVRGLLCYTKARALFYASQASLFKESAHSRTFILSRWHLGKYFYAVLNRMDKGTWAQWLLRYWPEPKLASIRFWVSFYLNLAEDELASLSQEVLKRQFMKQAQEDPIRLEEIPSLQGVTEKKPMIKVKTNWLKLVRQNTHRFLGSIFAKN